MHTKNLEELLHNYKAEQGRVRQERDTQWAQMTSFYEQEIGKLNARLLETQGRLHPRPGLRLSP